MSETAYFVEGAVVVVDDVIEYLAESDAFVDPVFSLHDDLTARVDLSLLVIGEVVIIIRTRVLLDHAMADMTLGTDQVALAGIPVVTSSTSVRMGIPVGLDQDD